MNIVLPVFVVAGTILTAAGIAYSIGPLAIAGIVIIGITILLLKFASN